MTERIIKTPKEATRYVDQVRTLGDANRPTLGFLRSRVYTEAAAKGRLWIAVSGVRKNLVGYLPLWRCVSAFEGGADVCTSRVSFPGSGANSY